MGFTKGSYTSTCLDCSKYRDGDDLGAVLAYACQAVYLSIILQAAVRSYFLPLRVRKLRVENDTAVKVASSTEYSTVILFQVAYARKDALDVLLFGGAGLNVTIGKLLKSFFRQPRPSATCMFLGVCETYGMPSTHAQVMAYCLTVHLALNFMLPAHFRTGIHGTVAIVEATCLFALSAVVSYARIYLGYHTLEQVLAGAATGGAVGVIFTWAAVQLLQFCGDSLCSVPLVKSLGFKSEACHRFEGRRSYPGKHQ